MFDLSTIKKMNANPPKVEDNHNRLSSFTQVSGSEVVLHSARLRNTAFLQGQQAVRFLNKMRGMKLPEKRNQFIESFFN